MDKSELGELEARVLICSAAARDGAYTKEILGRAKMSAETCESISSLCSEMIRGCGAIVIAREMLTSESVEMLRSALDKEPPWSHIALIVLASQGEVANADASVTRLLGRFRNVTLLERPVRLVTFEGIMRATLADRQRQYETRDLLEQLTKSNAALHDFASIASHDLKEPLRMVTAYLQLLARQYKGARDERADEYISFAVSGANRMRTLIEALLGYSKLGTEKAELSLVDCNEVVGEVLSNLEVAIKESSAAFEIERLPTVMGDRNQLTQLFQNLIANALKFKAAEPPRIKISARDEGAKWELSVRDNGIGFPMADAEKIFAMFRRLNNHDEYEGAGIGLSVCSSIVQRHGGKIWATSSPGHGAVFSFTLPKNTVPARAS